MGGSTENRVQIIKEIVQTAKEKVGPYPILAKFSAYDYVKNGIRLDEGVRIAELMQGSGVDAIEVSCGGMPGGAGTTRWPKTPVDAMVEYVPALKALPGYKKLLLRAVLKLREKEYPPLHNYNVAAAEEIRRNVDIPVIVVGGIRRLSDIEDIIGSNQADFVSLCRPLIIEPNLVEKFRSGKQAESRCINCGYCLFGVTSNSLRCYYGKLRRGSGS
jgi:2,4-dienoyl-CoA reductase-like NADH-dependent reductase (Old Yellow Enzyme family)